ncbi:hypothetical protein E8E14_004812 [Neopestalotiopsis sp. 37M]|nr:hypothetical protein E8E14_004812 [Neopestalotiopsis sp. 37M]
MASSTNSPVFAWFPVIDRNENEFPMPRVWSDEKIAETRKEIERVVAKGLKLQEPHVYAATKLSGSFGLGEDSLGGQKLSCLFLHFERERFWKDFRHQFIRVRTEVSMAPLPRPHLETVYKFLHAAKQRPNWTCDEYPEDEDVMKEWTVDYHYVKIILRILSKARHADVLHGDDDKTAGSTESGGKPLPEVPSREIAGAVEGNLTPWILFTRLDDNIWALFHTLMYLQLEWEAKRYKESKTSSCTPS